MNKVMFGDVCGPPGYVTTYISGEGPPSSGRRDEGEEHIMPVKSPHAQSHPGTVDVKVKEHAQLIKERRQQARQKKIAEDAAVEAKAAAEATAVAEGKTDTEVFINPLDE